MLMRAIRQHWVHLVHPAALAPLAVLVWDFLRDRLTANPIQAAEQRTGLVALSLLALTLACTPAANLFGWKRLLSLRRPLGLYAFGYAAIHVAIFVGVDYGLDLGLVWQAVAEKPYILIGLAALLLLAPLALTSTKGWMRRLGKGWKRLHRLIYVAAPLVVLHYLWSVKADYRQPLLFAAGVAILLVLRAPAVRARLAGLRGGAGVAQRPARRPR